MKKTIAALMALVGIGGTISMGTTRELQSVQRFRNRQKQQPRTAGTMRRSAELIDLETGRTLRGTRAKNRGPYPQHLIDNCAKMRTRNGVDE